MTPTNLMDRLAVKSVKEHRQPPTIPVNPVERQNIRQSKRLARAGGVAASRRIKPASTTTMEPDRAEEHDEDRIRKVGRFGSRTCR